MNNIEEYFETCFNFHSNLGRLQSVKRLRLPHIHTKHIETSARYGIIKKCFSHITYIPPCASFGHAVELIYTYIYIHIYIKSHVFDGEK